MIRDNEWPEEDDAALAKLKERAMHRTKGAILLNRVQELCGQRLAVPFEHTPAERSEDYVLGIVLKAFKRGYRLEERLRGRIDFDDVGVALIEDLQLVEVSYALRRLEDSGYIKSWADQHSPGRRPFQLTPAGLQAADIEATPDRALGGLVEETVAAVERVLTVRAPALLERLRTHCGTVLSNEELSELQVREIAQSCHHVIVEFLDLPILWTAIDAERPPKESTRDRLRLLFRERSKTDEETLEAFENYIVGWMVEFGGFLQKYRHSSPDSDRRQAKRMIVNTYLFIGDLIDILLL